MPNKKTNAKGSDSKSSQKEGKTTTDHETIRQWAEERDGRPSRVAGTESEEGIGILRIDFGEKEENLDEISWDDFFKTFDEKNLAFLYQEKTADGKTSRFFKFINKNKANMDKKNNKDEEKKKKNDDDEEEFDNDADEYTEDDDDDDSDTEPD